MVWVAKARGTEKRGGRYPYRHPAPVLTVDERDAGGVGGCEGGAGGGDGGVVRARVEGEEEGDGMEWEEEVDPTFVDVILTGETDGEHAARWGACTLYGRVRRNDGLVVFLRVPKSPTQGRWLFRAYLAGGQALAGRWRETGTSVDVSGYEGGFVLRRVGV
ncbi:hypothetical protein K439DRAFT_51441 [Ramaria rubella]|nr:hypothetical protein K439DRAFT_51441 [Ramaria rubella]